MTSRQSLHVQRSCVQHVLLTLIALVVTTQCIPLSDVIDGSIQDERWLADESFYDFEINGEDEEQPQADGRQLVSNDLCPPVPRRLPQGGCEIASCSSDRECADRHLKCCYNGCVYTCLPEVKPPAYFDWVREPVRRLQFGQSWLVPGPNLLLDVELCSTSLVQDDSDPLLCPHGYECNIDDVGRPKEGIPNRGHCVKVAESNSAGTRHRMDTTFLDSIGDLQEEAASLHACHLEEQKIILSGHSINLDGRTCLCLETRFICDDLPSSAITS